MDWSDRQVWLDHKTVDLACGSGTLLAAMLTDMKRRATERGANAETLTQLQKLAVEDVIKGLDINPVSLQLAASQLTAGNQRVSYRRMGLHQMPYGPGRDNPGRVSTGTLELLGQKAVVSRRDELDLGDDVIDSQTMWETANDAELENAVDAARHARIVIMNPPYTNRTKIGEKFPAETQQALRDRVDLMEQKLTRADPAMAGFADKNSIRPLFRWSCGPLRRAVRWSVGDDQSHDRPYDALRPAGTADARPALPHLHRANITPARAIST